MDSYPQNTHYRYVLQCDYAVIQQLIQQLIQVANVVKIVSLANLKQRWNAMSQL